MQLREEESEAIFLYYDINFIALIKSLDYQNLHPSPLFSLRILQQTLPLLPPQDLVGRPTLPKLRHGNQFMSKSSQQHKMRPRPLYDPKLIARFDTRRAENHDPFLGDELAKYQAWLSGLAYGT